MARVREILLPWDSQPQEAVAIDPNDPINAGSVFLWSAANPNVEVITGKRATTNNTTGVVDQYGHSVRSATGQTNLEWNSEFFKTSDGGGLGDFTALIVANPATSGSGAVQHIFSHKNDAGGAPYGQFIFAAHMNPSSGAYASGNATFFTYSSTAVGVAAAGATDGEMHVWGIRRKGNDHYLFKDGIQLATVNNFARDVVQGTTRYTAIGSRGNGTTEGYDRDAAFVQGWDRALSDDEILERSRTVLSVYRAFAPQTIWVPVSAGGGGYTLTADAGVFTLTGTSVTLTAQRKVTAGAESYALTGNAAGLTVQRKLMAEAGAYMLTGAVAGLTAQRKLVAGGGAYTLTGNDATLTYTPVSGVTYTLTAEAGSYTLTGNTTVLQVSRKLTAEAAAYILTGNAVTLTYTPVGGTPIYSENATLYYDIGSNLSLPLGPPRMPNWNTAGRPSTPQDYEYGYNITTGAIEVWNGSTWV